MMPTSVTIVRVYTRVLEGNKYCQEMSLAALLYFLSMGGGSEVKPKPYRKSLSCINLTFSI